MYCLTRYEMKFGDIVIPARTKCSVINKITSNTVNAPGIDVKLSVDNYTIRKPYIENENRIILYSQNVNLACLEGIVIDTNTEAVYMDAGDRLYFNSGLYAWELSKIFGEEKVPKHLLIEQYNGKDAKLRNVIDCLEDEFGEWVENNCDFIILSKEDIENGECFDGAGVGDKMLSDFGIEQFNKKKLEYQKKLEPTGFTYDFKGGLISN